MMLAFNKSKAIFGRALPTSIPDLSELKQDAKALLGAVKSEITKGSHYLANIKASTQDKLERFSPPGDAVILLATGVTIVGLCYMASHGLGDAAVSHSFAAINSSGADSVVHACGLAHAHTVAPPIEGLCQSPYIPTEVHDIESGKVAWNCVAPYHPQVFSSCWANILEP